MPLLEPSPPPEPSLPPPPAPPPDDQDWSTRTLPGIPPARRPLRFAVADGLDAGGAAREAHKLRLCRTGVYVTSCDQGHAPTLRSRGCDQRVCPDCRARLAGRKMATALGALALAQRVGLQVVHLVLTRPRVETIDNDALRELWRQVGRWWKDPSVRSNFAGLYACLEVEWSEERRSWHPHIHVLALLHAPADRRANPLASYNFGDLLRSVIRPWHGLTGCTDGCEAKAVSLRGGFDGCTLGGSVWMGDVFRATDSASQDVAAEVTKYIAKGAIVWHEGEDGRREVTARAGELAIAIRGLHSSRRYGCCWRLPAAVDDPAICETCRDANAGRELADQLDATIRYRGPPAHIYARATDGDAAARRILHGLRVTHPELWD